MRKIIASALLLILAFGIATPLAHAYTTTGLRAKVYYVPTRNEYRLDYYYYPSTTDTINLYFVSPTGTVATKDFTEGIEAGIFYLTCNGTYDFTLYANGEVVASVNDIETTLIENGSCNSYPNGYVKNDLGVTSTGSSLNWTGQEGAANYEVFKDGQSLGTTQETTYPISGGGSYTVAAYDSTGEVIGESDISIPEDDTGGGGTDPGTDPNACATLICQCIEGLKPALNSINENTGQMLTKLDDVVAAVNKVNDSVQEVKNQLEPKQEYPLPSADDYPLPTLEENKPPMHESGAFTDTGTYFTDQGDAAEPGPLPTAPEPVTQWKDSAGNVVEQQPELSQSEKQTRDPVLPKDQPLQRAPVPERDTTVYELRWQQYNGVRQ